MQEEILQALKTVIDPELNIDIVNLGLIYDTEVVDGVCTVTMTLTMPGCPLSNFLFQSITETVKKIDGIDEVKINLVWYPVWSIEKMSNEAKLTLGIPLGAINENN